MSYEDNKETIGVGKSTLTEFTDTIKGQLLLLTGAVDVPQKLSLQMIRRPKLVIGTPGIGKTCSILSDIKDINKLLKDSGKDIKLGFKKILLGQTVVGTLTGIPVINPSTGECRRELVPELPQESRDGEYGVLFLDEITTADEAQIQPALGLMDDSRSIGTYTLPEHWIVIAAGNGPDCANFLKLDDMTISRFSQVFDIEYDYKKDWRPWAHQYGINDLIIAYLNWRPEDISKVVSTEEDRAGKLFACPRTWTALSDELLIREATGKKVGYGEMFSFASRIIGESMARNFASFSLFKKKLTYNPENIINGTEEQPNTVLEVESFHILIEGIISALKTEIDTNKQADGSFTLDTCTKVANAVNWVLGLERFMLEQVINAIVEMSKEVEEISEILNDEDFLYGNDILGIAPLCPAFLDFVSNHASLIEDVDINALS